MSRDMSAFLSLDSALLRVLPGVHAICPGPRYSLCRMFSFFESHFRPVTRV